MAGHSPGPTDEELHARPGPRVADDHQITEGIRWSEREHAHTAANHHVFAAALR